MQAEISLKEVNHELKERGLRPFPVESIVIDALTESHLHRSAESIGQQLKEWVFDQQTSKPRK